MCERHLRKIITFLSQQPIQTTGESGCDKCTMWKEGSLELVFHPDGSNKKFSFLHSYSIIKRREINHALHIDYEALSNRMVSHLNHLNVSMQKSMQMRSLNLCSQKTVEM